MLNDINFEEVYYRMGKKEVLIALAFLFLGAGIGFNGGIHIEVPAFFPQIFWFGFLICSAILAVVSKKSKNKKD
jgi:hypothetical protein